LKIECYSYTTVVGLIQLMRLTINVTLAKDRAVIAKINKSPVSQFIYSILTNARGSVQLFQLASVMWHRSLPLMKVSIN